MQLKRIIAILATSSTMVFASPLWGQTASTLLQEGIFAEETTGDLDAAIEIYKKIAASAEKNRAIAAQGIPNTAELENEFGAIQAEITKNKSV